MGAVRERYAAGAMDGMTLKDQDAPFFDRAIELANEAELRGNLPIGAVIALDGGLIAEGRNAIWAPSFRPNRHAELEALRVVPADLWERAADMVLYSTLEPCIMCMGAILLHHVGRVCFGASDPFGGAEPALARLPPHFNSALATTSWEGPLDPDRCQPLLQRALAALRARGEIEPE
jgi:tRNA(adenine34) deaminase